MFLSKFRRYIDSSQNLELKITLISNLRAKSDSCQSNLEHKKTVLSKFRGKIDSSHNLEQKITLLSNLSAKNTAFIVI